jgi:N-acetylglutamate synthase-like GNAT family acetyltransferase
MPIIELLQGKNRNLVLAHYQKTGYSQNINPEDIIISAFDGDGENSQIIGAVRLCPQDDYFVLRGMQVTKEYQRQGIGTALLNKCIEIVKNSDKTCYCLPYKYLIKFYNHSEFDEIKADEAPAILKARLEDYLIRGLNVTIMRRNIQ